MLGREGGSGVRGGALVCYFYATLFFKANGRVRFEGWAGLAVGPAVVRMEQP